MKKILLGTTTLISAVALAASASAATPKVTLGGFVDFQAGIMSDDLDANQRNHAFRNDTEISVKVDGKTDHGLGYGGEVWLEADVEGAAAGVSDARNQGVNASKTFVYLEGNWGRVEGGSNVGADATMKIDASTIARATGGIDGDWDFFANANTLYLARPDLPMNYGLTSGVAGLVGNEDQENATKLTYYTPRWNGLQAGISYAAADTDRGQLINRVDNTAAFDADGGIIGSTINVSQVESIWQGGLSWEGNFSGLALGVSATGELGDAEAANYEDLRAWAVGGSIGYMGFTVAGSYGDWGDSLRLNTANADNNDYWTVGGAYEYGPFGVSVTYLKSNLEVDANAGDNEFDNLVVGLDYQMAPGFTPYIEASFYEQDAIGTANDNDGNVFIAGTLLSF